MVSFQNSAIASLFFSQALSRAMAGEMQITSKLQVHVSIDDVACDIH